MPSRFIIATLLTLIGAAPAAAQFESDSKAPIEIVADEMEWFNTERIAIARGNADAVQGRYLLHADVLTAHLSEGAEGTKEKIRLIEADGNVRLSTPTETATGETGLYDVENQKAVLEGGVVLTQGENVMRGARLVMDLATGRSTLEGGRPTTTIQQSETTSDGRVRARFEPESETGSGGGQ